MNDSNRQLMRRLFLDNEQRMYRTALRVLKNADDAEDAVQDAFLRAIRFPDKLSALSEPEQSYYLCAITRNTALNLLKKKNRTRSLDIEDFTDIPADVDIEGTMLSDFGTEQIIKVMSELSAEDYEVLWLYYLRELSANDTAELLGISANTVRQRVFRAKNRLKRLLEMEGDYD